MSGQLNEPKTLKLGGFRKNYGPLYAYPMGTWFLIFFVVPLFIVAIYSFLKSDVYGGVIKEFTFDAYKQMFSPVYGRVFLRTLWLSLVSTFFVILLALPAGYAMARSSKQMLLLFLVIIPFWTNSIIRIYAWTSILGNEGFINNFLRMIGAIGATESAELLYNKSSIILVLVYMYLPFAILPIFTSIDKFDFSLLEAARDLGASKPQSMFRVLLPNIKGGILTAVVFTFIPIFGAYTIPMMLGGKDSYVLGTVIVDQVFRTRNWPLASAFSVVITLISVLGVMLMLGSGKSESKNGSSHK